MEVGLRVGGMAAHLPLPRAKESVSTSQDSLRDGAHGCFSYRNVYFHKRVYSGGRIAR